MMSLYTKNLWLHPYHSKQELYLLFCHLIILITQTDFVCPHVVGPTERHLIYLDHNLLRILSQTITGCGYIHQTLF